MYCNQHGINKLGNYPDNLWGDGPLIKLSILSYTLWRFDPIGCDIHP